MQKFRPCISHPSLLRFFAGLLAIQFGTLPVLAESQGLLPSLEREPAAETPTMTPITELIGLPQNVEPTAQPEKKSSINTQSGKTSVETLQAKPAEVASKPASPDPKSPKQSKPQLKPQPETKRVDIAPAQEPALTPLLDQPQMATQAKTTTQPQTASKPEPTKANTLKPNHSPEESKTLTPLHSQPSHEAASNTALTPLLDMEPHDSLQPLHPHAASQVLSPSQPSEATPELTPLQPQMSTEMAQSTPTLDRNPDPASANPANIQASQEPQLKGPAPSPKLDGSKPLAAKASLKASPQKAKESKAENPQTATEPQAEEGSSATKEKSHKPHRKAAKFSLDVADTIQNTKRALMNEKSVKPISYTPLPGIAVFAVLKHGNERVFGDMPILFAREYAQRLGAKLPETKIYNPIYSVDELRLQGLGHVYDQIMSYYNKTGAPEPTATDYLLKQMSTNRPNISRVIFVEADVDFTHPDASTSLLDRTKKLLTDDMPKQPKYFVISRIQIFDAEKPSFPIVWSGSWKRSVSTDSFYNVTPSVYADSDSQQAFARVSRLMSQEMIYVTPKDAYMSPNFDTDVEGKLVSGKQPADSAVSPDSQVVPKGLSHENKQAIERILERQNNDAKR